jgi:hypothetical protein
MKIEKKNKKKKKIRRRKKKNTQIKIKKSKWLNEYQKKKNKIK